MNKILIVNDNLQIGGIQKALINMLKDISNFYDITVLLINPNGELLKQLPNNIEIISAHKLLSVIGASRAELKTKPLLFIWKAWLTIITRLFGKATAIKLAGILQKPLEGYDIVVSFSHVSTEKNLRSCSAEFVLDKTRSPSKYCWLHCDYSSAANRSKYTDQLYARFDKIIACSQSVQRNFEEVFPLNNKNVFTIRNFYDLNFTEKVDEFVFTVDNKRINIISVARLTEEKGLQRAIIALNKSKNKNIHYYILGDGPQKKQLLSLIDKLKMKKDVTLIGGSDNPAAFMKNMDYLLVPSFHEAAPIVFDEAIMLGLPIITTDTTSAREIVSDGIICENSEADLLKCLKALCKPDVNANAVLADNSMQREQLKHVSQIY